MQKKKNNATEKVENIIDNNSGNEQNTIANVANNSYDNDFEQGLSEARKAEQRVNKGLSKLEKKQQKKQAKLQAKKMKAEKLAKKKQLKYERAQAKKRLKEKAKAEKLNQREERLKLYREKHADKIQAKENRKQLRQERKQARYQKQKEKAEQKQRIKAQKRAQRLEKRQNGNKGATGFVVAIVSLSVATLVFATLFTVTFMGRFSGNNYYEASMERDFYDLVTYVDNIDTNMSKLMVSGDRNEQQKIIGDIMVEANLASKNIGDLPLQDESKYYTAKYINQVGDFSKYLSSKLIDGEKLTESDWKNIGSMYEINQVLSAELKTLSSKLGENYRFMSLLSDDKENVVLKSFVTLEENAVDYPQMIYDGPFSDGLEAVKVKGLSGDEINIEEAKNSFKSYFKDYAFSSVEVVGETEGDIKTYNVEGMVDDLTVYASITKVGGKLLSFNYYKDCDVNNLDSEGAVKVAEEFLKNIGIENMKAVWTNEYGSTQYINFVYQDDGVIYYPDMIKVSVCLERKIVNSFDATSYYLNHESRQTESAKISKEQAVKNLSQNLNVENVRLCVIPKGNNNEKLCYEILGTYNDSTYYVYVDAVTGKESQIFKVVKTSEGNMLV